MRRFDVALDGSQIDFRMQLEQKTLRRPASKLHQARALEPRPAHHHAHTRTKSRRQPVRFRFERSGDAKFFPSQPYRVARRTLKRISSSGVTTNRRIVLQQRRERPRRRYGQLAVIRVGRRIDAFHRNHLRKPSACRSGHRDRLGHPRHRTVTRSDRRHFLELLAAEGSVQVCACRSAAINCLRVSEQHALKCIAEALHAAQCRHSYRDRQNHKEQIFAAKRAARARRSWPAVRVNMLYASTTRPASSSLSTCPSLSVRIRSACSASLPIVRHQNQRGFLLAV